VADVKGRLWQAGSESTIPMEASAGLQGKVTSPKKAIKTLGYYSKQIMDGSRVMFS
jgi:hypothetical protein